jgi:hypothetical protein
MGIFNYIDTFFFISLGITFVLILLLVFHFKQQIVSLDHKNDTMFEIINNIVKEITYLKSVVFSHPPYHLNDHDEIINLTENHIQSKQIIENKIVVSDEEQDYSDDGDSAVEDSDNEDTDDSDDSDIEDSDEDSDDEDASDNDEDYQDTNNIKDTVKVINIEIGENIEVSEDMAELSDNNDYNDNDDNNNNNDNELNKFEENQNITIEETESIIVEKLDSQDNHLENNKENDQEKQIENIKEVYRKMTLIQLKALVISKGLTSDSSKMRKPELLKLLESNIDENN